MLSTNCETRSRLAGVLRTVRVEFDALKKAVPSAGKEIPAAVRISFAVARGRAGGGAAPPPPPPPPPANGSAAPPASVVLRRSLRQEIRRNPEYPGVKFRFGVGRRNDHCIRLDALAQARHIRHRLHGHAQRHVGEVQAADPRCRPSRSQAQDEVHPAACRVHRRGVEFLALEPQEFDCFLDGCLFERDVGDDQRAHLVEDHLRVVDTATEFQA